MLYKLLNFNKVIPIGLLAVLILFSSCYSYRLSTHAQAGTETVESATAHNYLWGLVKKPVTITTPVCDELGVNGVAEVTYSTNFGYALITVVTLGIWSPVKVQWKCSKPCKKTGTL